MVNDRYIFLDFDGVLNSANNYERMLMAGGSSRDRWGPLFDPQCAACLGKILSHSGGANIVVTSSWRYLFDLDSLREMWRKRNLQGDIFSLLPTDMLLRAGRNSARRGREIEEWFRRHGLQPDRCSYVILDDEADFLPYQRSHLVLTNPAVGLSEADGLQALALLRTE